MQRNFTDPESRIMKTSNGFVQGYYVQAVVDEAHQVIVATSVSNTGTDIGQIPARVRLVMKNTGRKMKQLLADKGYAKTSDMQWLEESVRVDGYVAVSREKHHEKPIAAARGRIPKNLAAWQRMERKLRTKRGRWTYAKRKMMVEPVFGQIKECRGFRRFSLRGQGKVSGEWDLVHGHRLLRRRVFSAAPDPGQVAGSAPTAVEAILTQGEIAAYEAWSQGNGIAILREVFQGAGIRIQSSLETEFEPEPTGGAVPPTGPPTGTDVGSKIQGFFKWLGDLWGRISGEGARPHGGEGGAAPGGSASGDDPAILKETNYCMGINTKLLSDQIEEGLGRK